MNRRFLKVLGFSPLLLTVVPVARTQSQPMTIGPYRMEVMLERMEGNNWHAVDPALVLNQGDRVRFRFSTNFNGYLYVSNLSSSGKYEQLFPSRDTGQDNHISGGRQYRVPATEADFRVEGPPGYETVYWMVSPTPFADSSRTEAMPPDLKTNKPPKPPESMTPRCDDTIWKARGDCIDHSAGPKMVPRDMPLPQDLAKASAQDQRELLFMKQEDKSVISSPAPLTGPVIYQFRLAHK